MKKIITLGLIMFFTISCTTDKQQMDNFSNAIIESIKTQDAQQLYELHISPEILGKYGMFGYVKDSYLEAELIRKSDDFLKISRKRALADKAQRIESMKNFIASVNSEIDWNKVSKVETKAILKQTEEFTDIIHDDADKVKAEVYELDIEISTDGKIWHLKSPFAMKIDGDWTLNKTYGVGLDLND